MPRHFDVRRWLNVLFLLGALASFAALCAFKVLDRDFWWHVTAGELMWNTGKLIAVEPFAYTREGLPYLATHEWLAQLILYGVWHAGGVTGVIAFRTVMVSVTFLLLLFIDPRRIWPNALLTIVAAGAVLGSFLERPQLFTYVIVAAQLPLALRYLDGASSQRRWRILAGMILLQILWVNLHGGAAMVGVMIAGSLLLQRAWSLRRPSVASFLRQRELWLLAGTCAAFCTALFLSPSGIGTLDYLHRLLTDKTIAFISEWQPRDENYALFVGPFWVLWILPLSLVRRDWVFCALVAGVTGYLSLTAIRHETLFVCCVLAVAFHQLKHAPRWEALLDRFAARGTRSVAGLLVLLVPVGFFALSGYRHVVERDHLWGYGVFAPAAGAADFVEKEGIRGNMFNTYGIGGYLIHRFFPDPTRKVFIDGRNVDYGYAFMNEAFVAGHSAAGWKTIEDKWDLTYAFVDYDAIKQPGWLSYSRVLDADPSWPLVYIDDWTAVYVKDIPQHRAVAARHRYRLLTAEGLEFKTVLNMPKDRWPALEAELRRAVAQSDASVKARNLLATLLLKEGKIDEIPDIADQIERIQPHRPEASALRAALAMMRQDHAAAGMHFERMLSLAGDDYPDISYAAIADVFQKAGDFRKAKKYRAMARARGQDAPEPAEPIDDPAAPVDLSGSGAAVDLFAGMQQDIEQSNDAGVELAQGGALAKARESFMKALMLDPGNPLTLSNLCALSLQEGKIDEAIELCERARPRGEEFADLHYNLSLAYLRAGRKDKAAWHAGRAADLGRDVASLREAIGGPR
jgi:tetratricopeptide (TPR) repeat protein